MSQDIHHRFTELEDTSENLHELSKQYFLFPMLRITKKNFSCHSVQVIPMSFNECVEVAFFLTQKVRKLLPGALDNFQPTVGFQLADEVYHLG
jgi:hypothetical protein